MFKYNVQILKVSGRLNESVLPSKNLVIKSKSKKTDEQIFAEASKYFKNKYGLVIESLNVTGFDGEEPSNVTTGNTQGEASFTKQSNTVTFGEYSVEKNKWIGKQYSKHDFFAVMREITYDLQDNKVHYVAEDNEQTGTSDEFEESVNEVRTFNRRDEESIMDAIKEYIRGRDTFVSAKINKNNEIEIYVTKQYSGDWVEYKERWIVSL